MIRKIIAIPLLFLFAAQAHALDTVSIEGGGGTDGAKPARLGLEWRSAHQWLDWETSIGSWTGGHGKVYDFAFTPVAHWGRSVYVEAGVGAHVLSDLDVGTGRDLSTRFQFGDYVGAGMHFGKYDVGLRLQHLSNGGLRNPNPGINFVLLRLAYHPG